MGKAARYIKSTQCKKLKFLHEDLNFEVGKNCKVSEKHLQALLLYCDSSAFCTAFSETFRREHVFESVESVISRHSEFANFGKLSVELDEWCGINGAAERGPFFCGINCVLNIGSFAITLKGPCSTSIVKEVAISFAKENGMVFKLNNDSAHAQSQNFFDCAGISNYFEESERLWIAGRHPQRLVYIAMVQNAKNYMKTISN